MSDVWHVATRAHLKTGDVYCGKRWEAIVQAGDYWLYVSPGGSVLAKLSVAPRNLCDACVLARFSIAAQESEDE